MLWFLPALLLLDLMVHVRNANTALVSLPVAVAQTLVKREVGAVPC